MNLRAIKSDDDYRRALVRIKALMDAGSDSNVGAELDELATLVDAYEAEHCPIDVPDRASD